jgi:antitoxin HicB
MIYFAKLHKESDGYWTEFPELNCSGSEGSTLEEVYKNSKEALEAVLESLFDRKCEIPSPKFRKGKGWLAINVDDTIAIPIIFRQLRLAHGLTLKQMAKRLGITYQSYQALETLRRANPTIKTLRKVADAFEIPLSEILKDVA